jgi:hypothetical protein
LASISGASGPNFWNNALHQNGRGGGSGSGGAGTT